MAIQGKGTACRAAHSPPAPTRLPADGEHGKVSTAVVQVRPLQPTWAEQCLDAGTWCPPAAGARTPCPEALARLEGAGACQSSAPRGYRDTWLTKGLPVSSRGSPCPAPRPDRAPTPAPGWPAGLQPREPLPAPCPGCSSPGTSILRLPRPGLGSPARGGPGIPPLVPRRPGDSAPTPCPRFSDHGAAFCLRSPDTPVLHPRSPDAPVPHPQRPVPGSPKPRNSSPAVPRPRFPPPPRRCRCRWCARCPC